ncbi:hypothetical protein ACN26Z_21230 [Verrucosispora sp. WMMD703]|uniref:hypothetical protein n=1 Tax=Verrucosispora sp. WMMD703 TaxID=3403463 RepID=UPI003B948CF6
MAVPWDVLAPTLGGVAAALAGGTAGGWLAHRSQRTHWTRDSRLQAYAELVRCYAEAYSKLSEEPSDTGRARVDWSDWNRALAVVSMIAPTSVAIRAIDIDAAMWRLTLEAERGYVESWVRLREPLEGAVLEFLNDARRDLGERGERLVRLSGRPSAGDAVWRQSVATPPACGSAVTCDGETVER